MVIGIDGSLIWHGIFLADRYGTKKHLASGREEEGGVGSYIIIDFLAIFKGETGERYHLNLVASKTD